MQKLLDDHEFIYKDPITSKMLILSRNNIVYYSSKGDIHMVKIMLENGANINLIRYNPKTQYSQFPLMMAVINGHIEMVRFLLDSGADPNLRYTYKDYTSLMYASSYGHFGIVRLLVERGADIYYNAQGHNAFTIAHNKNHIEILSYLYNPSEYYMWQEESLGLDLLFN